MYIRSSRERIGIQHRQFGVYGLFMFFDFFCMNLSLPTSGKLIKGPSQGPVWFMVLLR